MGQTGRKIITLLTNDEQCSAVNILRVTVNCFPFDVTVFAMLPAHGIWQETASLLDVMWPWTSQWMGALKRGKSHLYNNMGCLTLTWNECHGIVGECLHCRSLDLTSRGCEFKSHSGHLALELFLWSSLWIANWSDSCQLIFLSLVLCLFEQYVLYFRLCSGVVFLVKLVNTGLTPASWYF